MAKITVKVYSFGIDAELIETERKAFKVVADLSGGERESVVVGEGKTVIDAVNDFCCNLKNLGMAKDA